MCGGGILYNQVPSRVRTRRVFNVLEGFPNVKRPQRFMTCAPVSSEAHGEPKLSFAVQETPLRIALASVRSL